MYFVEGNIGSGKSTFLTHLANEFKVILEPVDEWTKMKNANGKNIIEEFYNDPARNAYLFQSIAFRSRMKNITNKEGYFIERSIFTDRNIFAQTCRDDGLIGDIEWDDYVSWFDWLTSEFKVAPKGIIYLRCDPDVSLERIKKRNRSGEETISIDYLRKLHEKHEQWLLNEKSVPVLIIDVTTPDGIQEKIEQVKDYFFEGQ
jgi:deoxyadenosine/deoxycytidine kinase